VPGHFLETISLIEACEREYGFVSRRGRGGTPCRWGDDNVAQAELPVTANCLMAKNWLNRDAAFLNSLATLLSEPAPYQPLKTWTLNITQASLSHAAAAAGTSGSLDGEPDPYVVVARYDTASANVMWPLQFSAYADGTRTLNLSPVFSGQYALVDQQHLILLLVDYDQDRGEIVDSVVVPEQNINGILTMRRGSRIQINCQFSKL